MAGRPGTDAGPGASEAREALPRDPEEEFEAQREAARDENRSVEERQHAPRGPGRAP